MVIDSKQKAPLENLRIIRDELINRKWAVEAFIFQYKKQEFVVLVKVLSDREKKENKYAIVNLEFIKMGNGNESYCAYADTTKIHVPNLTSFRKYFGIEYKDNPGDITKQFTEYFSTFIPNRVNINKEPLLNDTIINYLNNNREAGTGRYCFDFKRNGMKKDGTPKQRRPENNQKAEFMRPDLFEKLKDYTEFSFCFSEDPLKEETDEGIYRRWAARNNIL
ncbi:DUF6037 family protein [Peribacillus simplex]|uniref:DUF6037 family protein n=1 Tax=Peribacillus simplex TaxID=1478 RepID=UPI003D26720E